MERTYVGFGFGAIQAGLFLFEAWRSGRFGRLVVSEVAPEVVAGVRGTGGRFGLNVAGKAGITAWTVPGVEILDPSRPAERGRLVEALAQADEIGTALPSVSIYATGGASDVAGLLAEGLVLRARLRPASPLVVYAAENHNQAAEILQQAVERRGALPAGTAVQFLNTVIGKMSGVVGDLRQIAAQGLVPLVPGSTRAFLVEEFNRILISRITLPGFRRGLEVFAEKEDLLPFEEAKLFGHNATHALLGYLLAQRGVRYMHEAAGLPELVGEARRAFLEESGVALCRRHAGLDPLFTPEGYRRYAEDLLERMLNPHLRDAVERVTRDPLRKLGWEDRLVGTMRLALEQGLRPSGYARGAAAAAALLAPETPLRETLGRLEAVWVDGGASREEAARIASLILEAAAEPGLAPRDPDGR